MDTITATFEVATEHEFDRWFGARRMERKFTIRKTVDAIIITPKDAKHGVTFVDDGRFEAAMIWMEGFEAGRKIR